MIDGTFQHQDSHGGGGTIQDGATQYMTAGSGVLHIETPPDALVMSGGIFHGIQLWINLPAAKKMINPAYQSLEGGDVVLLSSQDGGSLIRVLAGEIGGHTGPGKSQTPMTIAHITLAPGASVSIPWNPGFNALAYTLAGQGTV
jgi:redox-sensitive bicupin YhaK (pirin superfamily)